MLRALAFCFLLLGASQADAQSLVGKWDCEARDGPGMAVRTLQEFRANGLFYHLANFAAGDSSRRLDAAISLRGTWKLENGRIVETLRRAKLRSLKENGQDVSRTPMGRRMTRELPKTLFGPNNISRMGIQFISDQQYKVVDGRIRGICTRR